MVRVGADLSDDSHWNAPVDVHSGRFVYVPIVETKPLRPNLERKFTELLPHLHALGEELPLHLTTKNMHLDPDFEFLTYGDQGQRAKQIQRLGEGDLIVFYASLRDITSRKLIYAIIGLYIIDEIVPAADIPRARWNENAHTRRKAGGTDIVVRAAPKLSGRFTRCLPIGDLRDGAYRVRKDLLRQWGELSVKDGYLQRSARLPTITNCPQFYRWIKGMTRPPIQRNN